MDRVAFNTPLLAAGSFIMVKDLIYFILYTYLQRNSNGRVRSLDFENQFDQPQVQIHWGLRPTAQMHKNLSHCRFLIQDRNIV